MPYCSPSLAQHLGIAAAAAAEGEVVAGDDAGGADPLGQHLADEILGAGRGEVGVELEHQHRVGAGMGEQPLALVEAWSAGRAARRA